MIVDDLHDLMVSIYVFLCKGLFHSGLRMAIFDRDLNNES